MSIFAKKPIKNNTEIHDKKKDRSINKCLIVSHRMTLVFAASVVYNLNKRFNLKQNLKIKHLTADTAHALSSNLFFLDDVNYNNLYTSIYYQSIEETKFVEFLQHFLQSCNLHTQELYGD